MKKLSCLAIAFFTLLGSCTSQENKKVSIAILTPMTHPSLEQIEKGFKETMEAENPGRYRFVTYNAQGNKTLMRGEIEEILQKDYSLLFTLASCPSQMASEVFSKKGVKTPIVFTCVNDPFSLDIVASEQSPGKHVTGVQELLDFRKEIEYTLKYKPEIKRVLLVFNPMEPGLAKDQKEISLILKEKDIELITIEVFQTNELAKKVSPFMDKGDAVLVLKDNLVVSGLDILIKLCNEHHIPLIASDLDSPDRGSAFGYGVYEIEFGIEAAKKALQILNQQKAAEDIPVTPVSKFIFKINREAALAQGIAPSLLERGEILP